MVMWCPACWRCHFEDEAAAEVSIGVVSVLFENRGAKRTNRRRSAFGGAIVVCVRRRADESHRDEDAVTVGDDGSSLAVKS